MQIEKSDLSFIKPIKSNVIKLEEYVGIWCKGSIALECEDRYGDWGRYEYQYKINKLVEDSEFIYRKLSNKNIEQFDNFQAVLSQKFPQFADLFSKVEIQKLYNEQERLKRQKRQKANTSLSSWLNVTESISEMSNPLEQFKTEHNKYNVNIPLNEIDLNIFVKAICDKNIQNKSYLFLGKHYIVQRIIFDYWTKLELGEEKFKKFDLNYNEQNRRHDHKKERFTKKMQWIGMYEYMGYLRNYLGHIPHLARLESYLYFYDFSDEIQKNILNYLSENDIDEKLFFYMHDSRCQYFYLNSDISLHLDSDDSTSQRSVFPFINSEIVEEIHKVNNQKEIHDLNLELSQTNDVSLTDKDKQYINDKLFIGKEWLLLYGIEKTYNSHVVTFSVRALIYDDAKHLRDTVAFDLPHMKGDSNEGFLEITRNYDGDQHIESFLYESQEKRQDDFSRGYFDRETLSPLLITKYSLIQKQSGYEYEHKLVIKKNNELWYIHKDFINIVINDYLKQGKKVTWSIFFEKMLPIDTPEPRYNEWRGDLGLNKNQLQGALKSHPRDDDFNIKINIFCEYN